MAGTATHGCLLLLCLLVPPATCHLLLLLLLQALLSLGDLRRGLTGLQWSYAKMSGPSCVTLLSTCLNLRSLKLRLWYQDYNLQPFDLNLLDLSCLQHLKTLVIDKRPPFQQQLPAQQSAISIPVTTPVLSALAEAWPHLQKLQLGLARSDFGASALDGLSGFKQLQSLSIHCYDQGFDDGHFMLPVDVSKLPASLTKLDLMHAELFSSSGSSSGPAQHKLLDNTSKGSSNCFLHNHLASGSNISMKSSASSSFTSGKYCPTKVGHPGMNGSSSSSNSSSSNSSNGAAQARSGSLATSAFASMLSESFSMLSRQASTECSSAYLEQGAAGSSSSSHDQWRQQQQDPPTSQEAGQHSASSSCSNGMDAAALAHCRSSQLTAQQPYSHPNAPPAGTLSRAYSLESSTSGWLQVLCEEPSLDISTSSSTLQHVAPRSHSSEGGAPPAAPRFTSPTGLAAAAAPAPPATGNRSGGSSLSRQTSLPPLPQYRTNSTAVPPATQYAAQAHIRCKQAAKNAISSAQPMPESTAAAAAAVAAAAACNSACGASSTASTAGADVSGPVPAAAVDKSRSARLQNPFAAAAAAAAVHAAVGGCVAAVDPAGDLAAGLNGCSPEGSPSLPHLASVTKCQQDANCAGLISPQTSTSATSSKTFGGLGMSFSVNLGVTFGINFGNSTNNSSSTKSKAAAAAALAASGWTAVGSGREICPCLPLLQQLQLKHCSFDGICLEDIVTSPKVSLNWSCPLLLYPRHLRGVLL
jgi:hypothetical protein